VHLGVVGDDHHVQLAALRRLADGGEVRDGGELAGVLAQEQLHVAVVVVAEVLRLQRGLDLLLLRAGGRGGGAAVVPARGDEPVPRGARRGAGVGGGGPGGALCGRRSSGRRGDAGHHGLHGEVQFGGFAVGNLDIVDRFWCVPGVDRKRKHLDQCHLSTRNV